MIWNWLRKKKSNTTEKNETDNSEQNLTIKRMTTKNRLEVRNIIKVTIASKKRGTQGIFSR